MAKALLRKPKDLNDYFTLLLKTIFAPHAGLIRKTFRLECRGIQYFTIYADHGHVLPLTKPQLGFHQSTPAQLQQ
jgi:hypothetical protein